MALLWCAPSSPAQQTQTIYARLPGPTEQDQIAEALRSQPPKDYEFNRASLRDVLRFLAQDARISFVSLPEAAKAEENLVTFNLYASPFRALEVIAKANGVALFYEDGIWYLRPFDDKELVGRTYKLKYNTQEEVTYDDAANTPSTSSTSSTGGSGNVPDLGLSLSGNADVFTTDSKQLVDDIKALLGIPTRGFDAVIAEESTVDASEGLGTSPSSVLALTPDGGGETAAGEVGGPQVIWNSDSNTLYVVATRQQHQWVEGYIASMDRPQALIAIEVKFFETTKDPRKQLGVDWSGTLENGLTVAARGITASPTGVLTVDQENNHQTQSGNPPPPEVNYDYTQGNKTTTAAFGLPYTAVLTSSDVAATLRAFLNDRDISTVSYPRVLTRNNREVVIRSVVNQPVLAATSSVTPGVGGTTTASVSYLPIGTIINVLPKTMSDGSVMLNVAVTVSSIIGEKPIQGNLYPIATTRVYNAALEVDSGYTLAIGGIEEAIDSTLRNGVPLLKDIPVLGAAFRSDIRSQTKKNLILFITPTILDSRVHDIGIATQPESTIPIYPGDPTPPAFTTDGALVGGLTALPEAMRWLERQRRYYAQLVKESRVDQKDIDRIESLIGTCELLQIQIAAWQTTQSSADLLASAEELSRLSEAFYALTKSAKKNIVRF